MSKKSNYSSLRLLQPSYYWRRPRRLGAVLILAFVIVILASDHRSHQHQIEALSQKLLEVEGEKDNLLSQVSDLRKKVKVDGPSESEIQEWVEGKVEPLILGVGDGGGTRNSVGISRSSGSKRKDNLGNVREAVGDVKGTIKDLPRKLLPEMTEKSTAYVKSKTGSHEAVEHEQGERLSVNDPLVDIKRLQGEEKLKGQLAHGGAGNDVKKQDAEAEKRREAVKKAMLHSWNAYEQYAWGYDELQPQSKNGVNHFGGLGATILDSLDTLWIMGLKPQYEKARSWVVDLNFNKNYDCSVFETTIRALGGLISAYDLSGDEMYIEKAVQLADRLSPAFNTPTGIPLGVVNLASGRSFSASWTSGSAILADLGTQTLEYVALSQRTGDPKYAQQVEKVARAMEKIFPEDGLLPIYINPDTGLASGSKFSIGAMGDSFYEYLLKAWVQGGKSEAVQFYRDMWDKSMQGLQSLVMKSTPSGFTYLAERQGNYPIHKMDHLACFASGMLVLGAEGPHAKEYLDLAKELGKTCYAFYESQPSKLSGEHYLFNPGNDMQVGHGYNIGRPETVESLFYLWRRTKDPKYREWGWNIFQAFQEHCRLPSGYTGLLDVSRSPPVKDDMMQSFFLAETLKYLFLLFSPDDVMPLDEWVFNTEAHPLRIRLRHEGDVDGASKAPVKDARERERARVAARTQGGEAAHLADDGGMGGGTNPAGEAG